MVKLEPETMPSVCPCSALREYSSVRLDAQTFCRVQPNQFFVHKKGEIVKKEQVLRVLRKCLSIHHGKAGAQESGTHSFQIGRATDMFCENICVTEIQKAGRWQSKTVYKYIKP